MHTTRHHATLAALALVAALGLARRGLRQRRQGASRHYGRRRHDHGCRGRHHGRRSERRAGHHRLVAHPEQRPGQGRLAGHRRRVHGRAPERHDQHHGPGERGVQGQAPTNLPGRRRARPVPVVGRRRPARAGRGRPGQGHHRRRRRLGSATSTPAPSGMYQVDGKQYGIPFDLGMVGFWYNKDLFAQAGITAPPTTWDELLSRRPDAQGRRHHPDRRRRQGQVAGALLVRVPRGPPRRRRRDGQDRRRPATSDVPCFVKAGEKVKRARSTSSRSRTASWPRRGTAPDGESRHDGHRQGAAMELMGQWAPGTFSANSGDEHGPICRASSAGSRSRRSTAAPAHPTDGFGGGNGFAVGKDAPPETVDFLQVHHQRRRTSRRGRTQQRDPAGRPSAPRRRHRPEPVGGARRPQPRRRSSSCTSTRRHRRARRRDQRRSRDRCSPGPARPRTVAEAITRRRQAG